MTIFLNAASSAQSFLASPIFMFIIIIAIMYFLMIRPQRKQQQKIENFRRGLQIGQEVITSGGLYGKVKDITETVVSVEIAHNVVIRVDKSAIYANPATQQDIKK